MAINEACQVWIEQRIQEELADKPESGKSLREIGRELAAEIERIFEAKVNPLSLGRRAAEKYGARNSAPPATPQPATVEHEKCPSCPKLDAAEVHEAVKERLKHGGSVVEAATAVARELGAKPESVRKAYGRERERLVLTGDASEAMQFATMAVITLGKIRKDDTKRREAFQHVVNWIGQQEP